MPSVLSKLIKRTLRPPKNGSAVYLWCSRQERIFTGKSTFMASKHDNILFQLNGEVEWQDVSPGIKRQIFGYNDKLMLVKVRFEKGAIGTLHHHIHSQASYVESGKFELTIGGEKKILQTGDGYFVPPNIEHGCICLEEGILIDVFNPAREDFI